MVVFCRDCCLLLPGIVYDVYTTLIDIPSLLNEGVFKVSVPDVDGLVPQQSQCT